MNRLFYLFVFIFAVIFNVSNAQSFRAGVINARVTDTNKSPLSFATVVLRNNAGSVVKTSQSSAFGAINIIALEPGDYTIEIREIGFDSFKRSNVIVTKTDSVIDLGTIVLIPSVKTLQEVMIKANAPLIEKQIDKTVVNVDQSITNSGTNALELMQKLPGVQMTADGQLTLNGRSGVNVLIDGKPTYLSAGDLAILLNGTPSSEIRSIEIMTNPSAKYDAAGTGGIINIVKKKNHKDGFNGSINGGLGQAHYGRYNGGLLLNYKNEYFNVFLNNNYNYNKTFFSREVITQILNGGTLLTEQVSKNRDAVINKSYNTSLGVDLYLSTKTTLTLTGNIAARRGYDETGSTMNILDGSYNKTNSEVFTASNIDKPFNYNAGLQLVRQLDTTGKELSFNADYSRYQYRPKQYNSTILNDAAGNFLTQTDVFLDQYRYLDIYGFRADYVQPFKGDWKLEAGIKSSYVKTNNNSTYYNQAGGQNIIDSTQSDYSLNTENIDAAYVNLNGKYGKLSIQAGLRGEQTVATGKQVLTGQSVEQNYFQLFPSLFTDYKLDDRNSFNFQLGRRTERADYHELVPFRRSLTPTLYFEGNPNLKPHLSWHAEATWSYRNSFFITLAYDLDRDYIRTLPFLDTNKTTSTRIPINIQGAHSWNINISYNKQITAWWATNNTVSLYQNSFNGQVKGFSLNNGGLPSVDLELNNSFIINDKLSAESNFEYDSKRQFVSSTYGAYSILSFGIKQQLFNKKGSISLNAHNVLQSESRNGIDRYENLNQYSYAYFYTRAVILAFNYRFGSGKPVKASKKSSSEDEQNRAGN